MTIPWYVLRSASYDPLPESASQARRIGATPFPKTVLTSSPLDINAVQVANRAFNTLLSSRDPITTPARTYGNCLTRRSDRLEAANAILRQENKELKGALTAKKVRLSGKRKAIDGKHLISTIETLDAVREAENATKKRAIKCTRGAKKRVTKVMKELSDESDKGWEQGEDDASDIMDYIVVDT